MIPNLSCDLVLLLFIHGWHTKTTYSSHHVLSGLWFLCNHSTQACVDALRPFHMFHRSGRREPLGNNRCGNKDDHIHIHGKPDDRWIYLRQGQGPVIWYNNILYLYTYLYTQVIASKWDDYILCIYLFWLVFLRPCFGGFNHENRGRSQVPGIYQWPQTYIFRGFYGK